MDGIKDKIINYIYEQGETHKALLSERDLAQHFDVKRSFVREILLTLEGEGLLERLPQRGYKFVNYMDDDWNSIWPIRYFIEREAIKMSIQRITESEVKMLEKLFMKMKVAAENKQLDEYAAADKKFHTFLVKTSKVKFLIRLFSFMSVAVFPSYNRNNSYMLEESLQKHEKILQAIQHRNWPEAELALHDHVGGNTPL